uniref:Uncharacterized protein n=1 Tax=viral metagenome TaxID=1070528 RepID=A0A6M3KU54_9ZZZZ
MPIAAEEKLKGEFYRLFQGETGISAASDAEFEYTGQYDFAKIWSYQVPVNMELIILPDHRASVYIEDDESSSAEWADNEWVRIAVWNPDLTTMQVIHEGRYLETKETADVEKMGFYNKVSEPVRIKAGGWIYVYGKCPFTIYTIDVSDSFFMLEMLRVRPSMFEAK